MNIGGAVDTRGRSRSDGLLEQFEGLRGLCELGNADIGPQKRQLLNRLHAQSGQPNASLIVLRNGFDKADLLG